MVTTMSGVKCHLSAFAKFGAGGISAGLPSGAPPSTQAEIVAISASLSDGSSLNFVMPMLRSMCQGGICRRDTFSLTDRAHGRASLYVSSDIGAIDPARWQLSHAR